MLQFKKSAGAFLLSLIILLSFSGCAETQSKKAEMQSLIQGEPSSTSQSLKESKESLDQDKQNTNVVDISNLDVLYEKYFKDVSDAAIASQSWDDASQIRPEFFINFFGARTELSFLSTDAESVAVPEEIVESFVQRYFDVDVEHMRQSIFYSKEAKAYEIPIPPGGASSGKVIDAVKKDNILILSYEHYSPADDTTVIAEGKLKIEMTDYSYLYKYISCDTTRFY